MRINIDITLHKFPCMSNFLINPVLSLCQEDELGNHIVDIQDTLHKIRLDKNYQLIKE